MSQDEKQLYQEAAFQWTCLVFQILFCTLIIGSQSYYLWFNKSLKGTRLDPSAIFTLAVYTFSFLLRLVLWALIIKATHDSSPSESHLLNILNLLINFKAAVIAGILYFFVMEMQPVRIILRSLTFEEYARRMKQ